MGVTRQYIYKLVKESKLRASRISGKKSLIRRADIELMMKTKPYERIMPKEDFDITEYYTAEEIADNALPLPERDMLPISPEEKIICYADKFYSKNPASLMRRKTLDEVLKDMERHGAAPLRRFLELHKMLG